MTQFLTNQLGQENFKIYIINQVDKNRFNRAALINVGYMLATGKNLGGSNDTMSDSSDHFKPDYLVMHDVDLLPNNENLYYSYPKNPDEVIHLASPEYHPIYNYDKFIGGVLIISNQNFEKLGGLSSNYWGWGKEDDDFYLRLFKYKLKIVRPKNLTTNRDDTFLHIHSGFRDRDKLMLGKKKLNIKSRYNETKFSLKSKHYIWFEPIEILREKMTLPDINTEKYEKGILRKEKISGTSDINHLASQIKHVKPAIIYDVELYCDQNKFICTYEEALKKQAEKDLELQKAREAKVMMKKELNPGAEEQRGRERDIEEHLL